MNKRISIGITVALMLVSVIASSVITMLVLINHYDELLIELPERAQQYIRLADVDELVRSSYYGDIDSDKIDSSLTSGYLSGLDDPYCYYISAEEKDAYNSFINGDATGIGITSYFDADSSSIVVSYVENGSPAEENGILPDYRIVRVNGKSIDESNSEELNSLINDSVNKKLRLDYKISSESEEVSEISIETGYQIKSCFSKNDGTVGYIRVTSVYKDTATFFKDALEDIKALGISAVILDLRNCVGNNFEIAAEIIDMIVPIGSEGSGAIFTAKNASGDVVKTIAADSASENLSFAVLINDRTECAAELIACDLRDFGKAVLIGETTAGHGTMQELFTLDNGALVSITVAKIYPYISESFDRVGVKPDIEVLSSESFKNQLDNADSFSDDEQYSKAYSYLTGK